MAPGTTASIISKSIPASPANFSPPSLSPKGTSTPAAFSPLVKATPRFAPLSEAKVIPTINFPRASLVKSATGFTAHCIDSGIFSLINSSVLSVSLSVNKAIVS